jgi:hypothetical protein
MTKPKPLTDWQLTLPTALPRHIRRNIADGDGGCWLWTRSRSRDGYGWASLDNRTHQAHRLVFRLLRGDPGEQLDHTCRVRHCVNPAHLEPVTPRENLLRSPITEAGRIACLKCGGAFSQYHGQRRCLDCLRDYRQRADVRERNRAQCKAWHEARRVA